MKAKAIVNRLLEAGLPDDPKSEAEILKGVKSLYYYYDVHVDFGGDEGYSAFIETKIKPPKGTRFGDKIQDDYLQQQIAAEAVRQGKVERADTSEIDYVALIDADEWSQFNTLEQQPAGPANCECDNTHQHNDTVCRWCFARGRRHFNDPAV